VTQFDPIAKDLEGLMGRDRLLTEPGAVGRYTIDGLAPKAVVFPKDTRHVADILAWAGRYDLAIVPWGSGTKMSTCRPPRRVDLVMAMARMNHMLDVDTANLTITVEAGVRFRDVQARLATEDDRCYLPIEGLGKDTGELVCSERSHSGCFLPLDPPFADRATMGGIIAANASGPRRLLYGLPRDLLLGVRFVTPGGDIVGAGGKTVKNVSGYDISKLMIGSFGTLGVLCEMTLRLLPLPEAMETLILPFGSFSGAQSFAQAVLSTKLLPAALEVANAAAMEGIPWKGVAANLGHGAYMVLVALEAFREAVERMRKEMIVIAQRFGATGHALVSEEGHRLFWLAVSDLQGSTAHRFPDTVSLQLTYPLSQWPRLFQLVERDLAAAGLKYAILCHAGSGVSVVHIFEGRGTAWGKDAVRATAGLLAGCRESGGNLTVLQAPPGLKGDLPVWGEAGGDHAIMKRIRERIDPKGLLSPGRFAV
jgi:FAD/FMN-containing dehydrogenase